MGKVYVFGHQKPDTDAVTSAITLSYLKGQQGLNAEPRILSDINKETKFVLDYFKIKRPHYLDSVKLQLKDINYFQKYYVNQNESLNDIYNFLLDHQITGIPVVDDNTKLIGIVTIKDLLRQIKNDYNYVNTNYNHLIKLLHGTEVNKINDNITGYIMLKNNNILITEKNEIKLIIISKDNYLTTNLYNNTNIIKSDLKIIDIIKLLPWCNYVEVVATSDKCYKFSENVYYDDFVKETNKLHFNNYPIVGKHNKCKGLIRITDIVEKHKKQVILVDHNEPQQSVDGLEEAEIVEIIDHHKIGALSTNNPISFRNMTVGSTSTIIYYLFQENNIEIPYNIGGLMLSGILSDTLGLTSSTTTSIDKEVVNKLSKLLNLDYRQYYYEMLKAGTSIEGETKEDIVKQDLKYFQVNDSRYAIAQAITLNINEILNEKDEYLKVINDYRQKHDLQLMIFFITDAIKNGSYLLYTDGIEDMIGEIFHLDEVYQGIFIEGLTSRKKQVVPYVNEYLK